MPDDDFGCPELWDEYQWERFLREQDQKTDQYFALFEKYSDHPERDEIIAREMGWTTESSDDEEASDVWDELEDVEAAEFVEDSGESEAGEVTAEDDGEDPFGVLQNSELYLQSMELNRRVYQIVEPRESLRDHPVAVKLATRATICSAKLAAALCGDDFSEVGMTIAYLKRSLNAANDCLSATMTLREAGLLEPADAGALTDVLFPIRERIVDMMSEYRAELRRRRGEA